MHPRSLTGPALAALCLLHVHASAAPTASPGYATSLYYTHSNADFIVSYDWAGANDLYYQTTSPPTYSYGGFFGWNGSTLTELQNASASPFAGASVVTIGDYVYFNTSPIYKYGPLSGTPALASTSNTSNYALFGHGGDLFIAGFGASSNEIFHSTLEANGDLHSNPAVSIGVTPGNSGPLAFDASGNLFYAQGFGGHEIYRWTSAEVADAIADPVTKSLSVEDHLWLDYSLLYSPSGATSMAISPDGDLLVTLTNFSFESVLASFDIAPDGSYGEATSTLVSDTGLLGEVRVHDGGLYVGSANGIYQIVPEPASALLLLFGGSLLGLRRRRA